ncbi:hypothetical protein NGI13_22380 [Enterobacter asburiae]|uniref:hypothetical protein n=1 Tax=Enterobacter TaxID=547 RepID=UPI0004DB477E|nr:MULTISPECIES: hypothetical protein [Enterobacter]KFA84167.1 hypothetical protein N037_22120 [Enterobacter sp. EGD-HP1]MEB8258300.1 hypothetical protein [Enterobacter asburiae]
MAAKLKEIKTELLTDALNTITCDEENITREERENPVRTFAPLETLSGRQRYTTDNNVTDD